ncbi:MAG: hypothetical protein NWF06_04985 [Candidatus Bathyarchaeota archaeon]|nr:hypothetical protein [Candidatus Bathyarchaeum sp.]
MKKKFTVPLMCILLIVSAAFFVPSILESQEKETLDCHVGVTFCGDTAAGAELLIDRVKDYTNLFVLQSGPISENETAMNEICEYAVDAGLDIIVYFGDLDPRVLNYKVETLGQDVLWRTSWINTAKQRWGDNLLAVYYYDEPGGNWLDCEIWNTYIEAVSNVTDYREVIANTTYDDVAQRYIEFPSYDEGYEQLENNSIPILTSDYVLYWFDYLMGYDVILTEVGWNHTIEQDIALVRGAANLQNKSWGTIITWKYNDPPYLDTPENIYNQMVLSYEAGAEYIVIFNYPTYPEDNQYGIMSNEHFEALESFWNDATKEQIVHGSTKAEAVLVLPHNYGWGMRNLQDKIWAFWEPDEKSEQIWTILQQLLDQYGTSLDIVYDDPAYPITDNYQHVYIWNQTITSNP